MHPTIEGVENNLFFQKNIREMSLSLGINSAKFEAIVKYELYLSS